MVVTDVYNLCLGCYDDLAEPDSTLNYCITCELKHEDAMAVSAGKYSAQNKRPTSWWGPTWSPGDPETNISGDDLSHGFTAEDEYGRPINLFFDAPED